MPTPRPAARAAATLLLLPALLAGFGVDGAAPGPEQAATAPAAAERPVALVTGSTDGLGRALALALAEDGYHVLVHGRNAERGAEVVAEIEAGGTGSAVFVQADFAELAQVREVARGVRAETGRLDLLVNNAGVGPGPPGHERVLTPDGNELRFQVNYLAGFLLTHEFLPLLEASAPSRIVNVTSRSQQPIDFGDLTTERRYSGSLAYGRSKLAQILFTFDLAETLEGSGVSVYAVHPAPAMDTGLVLEAGGRPLSTVEEGLAAVLQAVRTADHPSGTFFFQMEPGEALHGQAYDPEARRRLREISERLVWEGAQAR
jgi:NAD(P)-dependent dehydrogenase (short-subunit alcohol dehydrogenase family)